MGNRGGCCCHRSLSDVIVVSFLVLLTLYSTYHFYMYVFPHTLTNIWVGVTSVCHAVGIHLPYLHKATKMEGVASGAVATENVSTVVRVELVVVSVWSYTMFLITVVLLSMFSWAYAMAVYVAPGFIPFTFTQKEKLSASLSLNVFYEPLPYPKCATCERARRRESGSLEGSSLGGSVTQRGSGVRPRRNKDVYPPFPPVSTPPDTASIHRFAPQRAPANDGGEEMKGLLEADADTVPLEVDDKPLGRRHASRAQRSRAAAASTSSGSPTAEQSEDPDEPYEHFFFNRRANAYTSVLNHYLNFCPLCFSYKPQRAHHCSKCGKCILKYDHHCPWLGQCVGFFNYKNYLLVLLYAFLLTAWALLLLIGAGVVYLLEREGAHGRAAAAGPPLATGLGRGGASAPLGRGPTTQTAQPQRRFQGGVLAELRVGAPTFGVFVCFTEALLFCVMSLYLLRRHFFFARHNISTIDVVIHEHERMRGDHVHTSAEDQASTAEDEDENENEAGGGGGGGGEGGNYMLHNNKKHYRERTLNRFLRKNVYDLGVRRNLLQVFGDAEVHPPPCNGPEGAEDAEAVDRATPYFQDLMESDAFRHKAFVKRWFWRLLPFPAYPAQVRWEGLESMKRRQRQAGSGYGATAGHPQTTKDADGAGAQSNSILLEFGVTERQLLGLRFPTKASLSL